MMTVMNDSQEGQPERVHLCTKVTVVFRRLHSGSAAEAQHLLTGRFKGLGLACKHPVV